jgi:D-arabinose 1-dehydrogenase-like Zn-dependent alcohol dehydrogenase
MYSPFMHWNAGPGKKVGIIGLGGLGHMGVKIAHALGAEVSVLSHSLKKREGGIRMGAASAEFETQEMLNFCSKHNIASDIEVTPIHKVNEAYERVVKSDVRYQFVIDMKSL